MVDPQSPAPETQRSPFHEGGTSESPPSLEARIQALDARYRRHLFALQQLIDTHLDETAGQLSRIRWATLFFSVSAAALALFVFWGSEAQLDQLRGEFQGAIGRLQQRLEEIAMAQHNDRLAQQQLAEITDRRAALSQSQTSDQALEAIQQRWMQEQAQRLAMEKAFQAQLAALQASQARLAAQLAPGAAAMAPPQEPPPPEAAVPAPEISPQPMPAENEIPKPAAVPEEPLASPPQTASQTAEREMLKKPVDRELDPEPEGSIVLETSQFGLQVIGFFRLDRLKAFAAQEVADHPLYYLQGRLQGRPWYALIYDLYPSASAAKAAIRDRLPEDWAKLDLWIRPLRAGTRLYLLNQTSR